MKKIFKLLLLFTTFFIYSNSYANQVDIYGAEDSSIDIYKSSNIKTLETKLSSFYTSTGLNTDIIVLGKGDSCYLENNFDSCVQSRENYSSDLLIILSMKSDIKDYGDIRTLIKDSFDEVITTSDLKTNQDVVISYFKNEDFVGGLEAYLNNLSDFVSNQCNEYGIDGDCKAQDLVENYQNYISESLYESRYNAMMRNIYIGVGAILIVVLYILLVVFYTRQINLLYKDIKFYILNIGEYKIFEKDKENIKEKLEIQELSVRNKLGDLGKNAFSLIKYYRDKKTSFESIKKELDTMQEVYAKKEELKEKVSEMKKINL